MWFSYYANPVYFGRAAADVAKRKGQTATGRRREEEA